MDGGWADPFDRMRSLSGLVVIVTLVAGCSSSIYGWQVRTESTHLDPTFNPATLRQEPVALLSAVTAPALRGNEIILAYELEMILSKIVPEWKVVPAQETASRINRQGLAAVYASMRTEYEQSELLDRDLLRKIGSAAGARYVFQPHLAGFTQTLTDRWATFNVRLVQTRASNMRLSLQLWDVESGALLWASAAETTMQSEAFSQDPVYFQEVARATLGSMLEDFLDRKTASRYTPANVLLDNLIGESVRDEEESTGQAAGRSEPAKK
jgi:hypothetical protein